MVGPHPGKEVSLQLEFYGKCIGFCLAEAGTLCLHFPEDSQQVLNMMAHFMRNYISYCKIALSAETGLQYITETQVDVYFFIARTVEGSAGSTGISACRLHLIPEKYQFRFPVGLSRLIEDHFPDILSIGKYHRYKLGHLIFLG